jgi:hypothetical protein
MRFDRRRSWGRHLAGAALAALLAVTGCTRASEVPPPTGSSGSFEETAVNRPPIWALLAVGAAVLLVAALATASSDDPWDRIGEPIPYPPPS